MSLEYHAWAVLGTTSHDWDDGQWDAACERVKELLASLDPKDVDWSAASEHSCPTTVCLCGFDVESVEPVKEVLARILTICDASYGELLVLPRPFRLDLLRAERYILSNGALTRLSVSQTDSHRESR